MNRSRPVKRIVRQNGMVLVIALIVLVLMTMGTLAMVRKIDSGNAVAGNLSFKQGATAAADAGTEAAIAWLQNRIGGPELYEDSPGDGYYATSMDLVDMTGGQRNPALALVDWDQNSCNSQRSANCIDPAPAAPVGVDNTVSYVINRLCLRALDPNDTQNSCASFSQGSDASPKRGELKYGDDKRFGALPGEYFRITTRVRGPRNTVSFVETIVHF
ncbi:pilus assembly PilX family protein [Noviherbaspirillum suwonense]|uniref:Tfp pilus assembly protein PilX n=1 Tax=Noviherbaspirillum suwonense TaxID=1224511 RepID=A0ABY1PYT0_9BURK|nr:hypothetical protein [Noviherbaspirillum suwonense]SMP53340.1 Tfp pilus assembly protein PilX [Noviherbaspirillum suwonense]